MNREALEQYILRTYGVKADYPWESPTDAVFRHADNRKWFALLMTIPASRLGLREDRPLDVVNLKCAPALLGGLLQEEGFFPAYHMNKDHWLSVALDRADADTLYYVLEESYRMTAQRRNRP